MFDVSTDLKYDTIQKRCGKYMVSFGDTEKTGIIKILMSDNDLMRLLHDYSELQRA